MYKGPHKPHVKLKDLRAKYAAKSDWRELVVDDVRLHIEKVGLVIAEEGDMVYVPPFTWHAPRWWGDGPACRLAMNGFPYIAHLYETDIGTH